MKEKAKSVEQSYMRVLSPDYRINDSFTVDKMYTKNAIDMITHLNYAHKLKDPVLIKGYSNKIQKEIDKQMFNLIQNQTFQTKSR